MNNQSIFDYNTDINKTAYMNWRMSGNVHADLFEMGRSFGSSALQLMDDILSDNRDKKADALIFSILYSVNQAIELYLKSTIRLLEEMMGESITNYKTHDIAQLLRDLKAKIKKRDKKTAGLEKHLSPLQDYLNELVPKIADDKGNPKMDFSRYPIDTEGNLYFYITNTGNKVVNIEVFRSRFEQITDCLEGLYMMYDAEMDAEMEQRYAMQAMMGDNNGY